MERRLASWKTLYLSKDSSLTLTKSFLSSNLPMYYLFLFLILVGVANHIEKLQRKILWDGINDEFKLHLASWSKICTPHSTSDLGLEPNYFSPSSLWKWLWHFATRKEAL